MSSFFSNRAPSSAGLPPGRTLTNPPQEEYDENRPKRTHFLLHSSRSGSPRRQRTAQTSQSRRRKKRHDHHRHLAYDTDESRPTTVPLAPSEGQRASNVSTERASTALSEAARERIERVRGSLKKEQTPQWEGIREDYRNEAELEYISWKRVPSPTRIDSLSKRFNFKTIARAPSSMRAHAHQAEAQYLIPSEADKTSEEGDASQSASLFDWIHSYEEELNFFKSAYVYVEVKLREIFQGSSHLESPNQFRTAACCDILERLVLSLPKLRRLFGPLLEDIFSSIYINYSPYMRSRTNIAGPKSSFKAIPYYVQTKRVMKERDDLQIQIAKLQLMLIDRDNASQTRLTAVANVLRRWDGSLVQQAFGAWKNMVKRNKTKLQKLGRFFKPKRDAPSLFMRWRNYTIRSRSDALRTALAVANKSIEECQEQLHHVQSEKEIQKQILNRIQGQLQIAEAAVQQYRRQMAMTSDEVVQEMEKKMTGLKIDYFRITIALVGERLLSLQKTFQGMMAALHANGSEQICDPFCLLRPKELNLSDADAIMKLKGLIPEEIVLRWINFRLEPMKKHKGFADIKSVDDLSVSFADGRLYVLLMNQINPDEGKRLSLVLMDTSNLKKSATVGLDLLEEDPAERMAAVLQFANEIGLNRGPLLTVSDVVEHHRADLNFVMISRIISYSPRLAAKFEMYPEVEQLNAFIARWEKLRRSRKGKTLEDLQKISTAINVVGEQVESGIKRLRDHNALWRFDLERGIHELATSVLVARHRGTPIVINDRRERKDLAQYKELVRSKLESLVHPDFSVDDELAKLQEVVDKHAVDVRRIFRYYAGVDGVGCTMSMDEYVKFVQDVKIMNKTLRISHVKKIFQVANEDGDEEEPAEADGADGGVNSDGDEEEDEEREVDDENPDEEFIPSEFTEALVRLAVKRFPRPYSLAERYDNLLINFVLKNACQSEKFRDEISQPKVKEIFDIYKAPLRKIFRFYAAGGQNPKKGGSKEKADATIDVSEFNMLVKDCGWVSANFTLQTVQTIFNSIQHGGDDDGVEDTGTELVIEEFLEGLAAIAVFKLPNPYIPLETRLGEFIKTMLLAPLLKVNTINGLKKSIKKEEKK